MNLVIYLVVNFYFLSLVLGWSIRYIRARPQKQTTCEVKVPLLYKETWNVTHSYSKPAIMKFTLAVSLYSYSLFFNVNNHFEKPRFSCWWPSSWPSLLPLGITTKLKGIPLLNSSRITIPEVEGFLLKSRTTTSLLSAGSAPTPAGDRDATAVRDWPVLNSIWYQYSLCNSPHYIKCFLNHFINRLVMS